MGIVVALARDGAGCEGERRRAAHWITPHPSTGRISASRDGPPRGHADVTAEAYRTIRNNIDFSYPDLRTLCVCGAASDDGAALALANLASAWAEHGASW